MEETTGTATRRRHQEDGEQGMSERPLKKTKITPTANPQQREQVDSYHLGTSQAHAKRPLQLQDTYMSAWPSPTTTSMRSARRSAVRSSRATTRSTKALSYPKTTTPMSSKQAACPRAQNGGP
ncbi:hypothetical protein LX36DRAFT_78690 [Colletotrichum falcatum]|nr:hypothetical protein LX36DRAFT_78690 [Colletotrichum falcatum]